MHTVYIVIAVIVVICIILMVLAALSRSKKPTRGHSSSESSSSRSHSHSHSSDSSSSGRSRYRVEKGNAVEQSEASAQPKTEVKAPAGEFEFPRHEAKAGRKQVEEPSRGTKFETKAPVIQGNSHASETIFVRSIADLFSPKEDVLAEFGVTPEEMDKLVEAHKKKQEPKERKLPINKNFNIESYNKSKDILRASSVNSTHTGGSKRGQITKSIYQKYGKNFTSSRQVQATGDVMATIPTAKQHEEAVARQNLRRNPGELTVRV